MSVARYGDSTPVIRNFESSLNFQPPAYRLSCCGENLDWTDVALGVITYLAELPLTASLNVTIHYLMERCGVEFTNAQEALEIIESIENMDPSFTKAFVKTAFLAYGIIFGPILEEFIFRHVIQGAMEFQNDTTFLKTARVGISALFFGLAHVTPNQGWTNVPIFAVTSFMGLIFALQKELTGGITASSTTHILHNATAFSLYYATRK